jgi:hypothetical protein
VGVRVIGSPLPPPAGQKLPFSLFFSGGFSCRVLYRPCGLQGKKQKKGGRQHEIASDILFPLTFANALYSRLSPAAAFRGLLFFPFVL